MADEPTPWWAVRPSGGRPEAGLVAGLAVAILAIGAGTIWSFENGWWRLMIALTLPGTFMLLRALISSLRGFVRPEESGAGWRDLVFGSLLLAVAEAVCVFVRVMTSISR